MIRSAILYHVYSGHLFFTAVLLFVIAIAAGRRARPLAVIAVALALLSGTPMPLWFALPLLVLAIAAIAVDHLAVRVAAIVAALAAAGLEVPYHLPLKAVPRPDRLIVIGDSLSSGGFGEAAPWPQRMGIPGVANFSRPSDTAVTATEQLSSIPPRRGAEAVIVEIGGNDMLERKPVASFAKAYDQILRANRGRTLVVLELPVFPGGWAYAGAQRRVAKRHNAVLVPKRALALVLSGEGNTSDGLHLTNRGQEMLAQVLRRELTW